MSLLLEKCESLYDPLLIEGHLRLAITELHQIYQILPFENVPFENDQQPNLTVCMAKLDCP